MGVNFLLTRNQGADQKPPQRQFHTKSPTKQATRGRALVVGLGVAAVGWLSMQLPLVPSRRHGRSAPRGEGRVAVPEAIIMHHGDITIQFQQSAIADRVIGQERNRACP
jgi:hypothetical protein